MWEWHKGKKQEWILRVVLRSNNYEPCMTFTFDFSIGIFPDELIPEFTSNFRDTILYCVDEYRRVRCHDIPALCFPYHSMASEILPILLNTLSTKEQTHATLNADAVPGILQTIKAYETAKNREAETTGQATIPAVDAGQRKLKQRKEEPPKGWRYMDGYQRAECKNEAKILVDTGMIRKREILKKLQLKFPLGYHALDPESELGAYVDNLIKARESGSVWVTSSFNEEFTDEDE